MSAAKEAPTAAVTNLDEIVQSHQNNKENSSVNANSNSRPLFSATSVPLASVHGMSSTVNGNLTLNQSIYANTVTLPKMLNGSAKVNGGGRNSNRHGSDDSNKSSTNTNNAKGLNTTKMSSSNSPATNTSYMDSSRDQSHHELEHTQLSPIAARPTASIMRTTPYRTPNRPNQSPPLPPPNPLIANGGTTTGRSFIANNMSMHSHQGDLTAIPASRDSSLLGNGVIPGGPKMNSTMHHNITNASAASKFNQTSASRRLNTSALLPANVSKFLLLSKEAGVRVAITSLAMMCMVSLLLALLSLVFLLRISPPPSAKSEAEAAARLHDEYQLDFLTPSNFNSLYEVTLALCALTLVLNLCCLLVCAMQFLFAVKLVKSPAGRHKVAKYLKGSAPTRICAIGGLFVSIPLFLTGVIMYTFIHFDSTPAIASSVIVGLGIIFCGVAVVHNVFVWQREKTRPASPTTGSELTSRPRTTSGEAHINLNGTAKTATGLPQATLDLSGPNASRVLELSTLV